MKIKEEWVSNAKVTKDEYLSMYSDSIENNEEFWNKQADRIFWYKKFKNIKNVKRSKYKVV